MGSAGRAWRRDGEVSAEGLAALRDAVALAERQHTQGSDARELSCALYEADRLIAGAWGRTEFQRLHVSGLWVIDSLRGQGLGADGLRQLEALALKRGCVDALAETLSDDVAALFEHLGYACIAHVHDFLPGFTRHTLLKVWAPRD
jgi:GNAT superfamily N-acetyltransferase